MRRLTHFVLLGLASLVTAVVPPILATDLPQFQPCWRGQSGTSFQSWGFDNTPTNLDNFPSYYGPQTDLPDAGWSNPNGTPQAVIVPDQAGVGWFFSDPSTSSSLSGIWDLGYGSGSVTLTIPNAAASPSLTREIWIQVTEASAADITTTNLVTVAGGTLIGSVQKVTVEPAANNGGGYLWVVAQWMFRVPANTSPNTITITGGCPSCNSQGGGENSFIESVVVDTHTADFSTISPGGSLHVGTQTECNGITFDPGSTYNWEMNDAGGAAGTGWDVVSVTGTSNITVQATSANKFTINLISLNGSSAGVAANFNNNNPSTWAIASAAGGSVLNFDPSKFALSYTTSQFQNNLGGGVFSVAQSGDGKSVNVVFTPNHPPTASDAPFTRGIGASLKFKIADLLANSTGDPDSDARALQAVDSTSAQGGAVTSDAVYIYYQPVNDNADNFNYTVRDVNSAYRAGDTVRTASARINITVVNAGGMVQTINTSGGGAVVIHSAGIPGDQYDLQRSATVTFTSFTVLLTTNAPFNGLFNFTDPSPPTPNAFYRLMHH